MINEGVAKLAKGNNYGGVNQFVTELIANEVAAVMTFSASQVLYKLNYSHLIEHLAEYAKDETKVSEAFIYPL